MNARAGAGRPRGTLALAVCLVAGSVTTSSFGQAFPIPLLIHGLGNCVTRLADQDCTRNICIVLPGGSYRLGYVAGAFGIDGFGIPSRFATTVRLLVPAESILQIVGKSPFSSIADAERASAGVHFDFSLRGTSTVFVAVPNSFCADNSGTVLYQIERMAEPEPTVLIEDVRRVPPEAAAVAAIAVPGAGARPAVLAVLSPTVVTREGLSLHVPGDAAADPWANAFFDDTKVEVSLRLIGKPPATVLFKARVAVTGNKDQPDAPEVEVGTAAVTSQEAVVPLPMGQVRSISGLDIDRDIVLVRVFQRQAAGDRLVATIQITPRPNLIRITALPVVNGQVSPPVEQRSFTDSPLTGGNLQAVLVGATTREPLSAGVFFDRGTPLDYTDDIAIRAQPVQFATSIRPPDPALFELGRPPGSTREVIVRATRHGLAQVHPKAIGPVSAVFRDWDDRIRAAARQTGIEASVVAGMVNTDQPAFLHGPPDNRPPVARNERDPAARDERAIDVNDQPLPAGLDPLEAASLDNVLFASPFYSSYPDSEVPDPFLATPFGRTSGTVTFNVIPVPTSEVNKKTIHVAFTREARLALRAINSTSPTTRATVVLDLLEVMAQAISVTRDIWQPMGVQVELHMLPGDLPPTPGTSAANILVISTKPGSQDYLALIRADPKLGPVLPFTLKALKDLRGAPARTKDTTFKAFTLIQALEYPNGQESNLIRFKPAFPPSGVGDGQSLVAGTMVFAEAFKFLQNEEEGYASGKELGTFLGNVIAHETAHHMGLMQAWNLSAADGPETAGRPPGKRNQGGHMAYRRNHVSYRMFRKHLLVRGPIVHRDVVRERFGFGVSEKQVLEVMLHAP